MRPWWRGDPEPGGDAGLLLDHARAQASAPPGPYRRGALIGLDAISATFEATDLESGAPLRLRALQPRFAHESALRRRFFAPTAPGLPAPRALAEARLWPTPGWPVVALDPHEDGVDTVLLARIAAGGLRGLERLQAAGRGLGGGLGERLFVDGEAVVLLDLDPFEAPLDPPADLAALGGLLAGLDPNGDDPIAIFGATLAASPPPSAAIAAGLLQATLGREAVHAHHRLAFAARRGAHQRRHLALLAAVEGLRCPPPHLTAALRGGREAVWVRSDAAGVYGGVAASPDGLSRVWTPAQGLDPVAARVLSRAWATRAAGDEAARRAANEDPEADTQIATLLRWLAATARLRAARLLLLKGAAALPR
jgi:hypothetical protein